MKNDCNTLFINLSCDLTYGATLFECLHHSSLAYDKLLHHYDLKL